VGELSPVPNEDVKMSNSKKANVSVKLAAAVAATAKIYPGEISKIKAKLVLDGFKPAEIAAACKAAKLTGSAVVGWMWKVLAPALADGPVDGAKLDELLKKGSDNTRKDRAHYLSICAMVDCAVKARTVKSSK